MGGETEEESSQASVDELLPVTAPTDFVSHARLRFPVVGIGASAGGLEPLQTFFDALPADSGMSFVIIQHLLPDRESMMADILSRHTSMFVRQIEDGMAIEINTAYVIRPGFTVTLAKGVFHLGEPIEQRGHRRPVDDFFRSLAKEQREKSIVVILSGMGTNGTSGAQAIKAAGGLCIAQEPASANFPGMPQSLIASGYADRVLKPADMPAVLLNYVRHPYLASEKDLRERAEDALLRDRQHLNEIFAILRTRTNHDFTGYKKATVLRRIQRRMGLLAFQSLGQYAARLRDDIEEVKSLANDLMINVTGFFRDPNAWEALRDAVVRPLVAERHDGSPIRAWVTACASGEEPYSLAMLLVEEAERAGKHFEIKIFATDTSDKSLVFARAGLYPGGIEGDLTVERLDRFFDRDEHTYRIKKEIREIVVFANQDLLRDPPFSRVDICTCRNLLIYLEPEVQQRVMALMHFSLREGGFLFLGNAETLGGAEKTFETISKKWRIYRRGVSVQLPFADVVPAHSRSHPEVRRVETLSPSFVRATPSVAVQQALLDQFAPPTIVVDRYHRIVYFHGDTAPYLIQARGEPTHDLFEVLHKALRSAIRAAFKKATTENLCVTVTDAEFGRHGPHGVQVSVAPLMTQRTPDYFRITFAADTHQAPLANDAKPESIHFSDPKLPTVVDNDLEEELHAMRRELQNTVEAFEASNEELKASNEEVVSINEELQSAKEELETSKEELQSLNEELMTVNGQLQTKIMEIEATTNDLTNLLSSTNIAVLFLDTQFRVRRFTPAMNDLLELIPSDIGRPIVHLAQKFGDGNLVDDAQAVLARLIPLESETRSHSGVWYLRRTLPYRTTDNRIDGVVITFVDITARKQAEQGLETSQRRVQAVIEQMPIAMMLVDASTKKLLFGNRMFAKLFGLNFPLSCVGSDWATVCSSLKGFSLDGRFCRLEDWPLSKTIQSAEEVTDVEMTFAKSDGGKGSLLMSSTPVRNPEGQMVAAVAAFWDITARKLGAQALRESEERCRLLVESATDYAIFTTDMQGTITSWNVGAERLLGWNEQEALGQSITMIYSPEDRACGVCAHEMRRALRIGRASDERQHVRNDGTRFYASGMLTRLTDSQGTLQGFAKIMRDITQRRESELELQKALKTSEMIRREIEHANRAKDEFISMVSHELRTPLNTIRLWSQMLGSGRVPQDHWNDGIKMIDRSARSQQQLIDDLLDVSRMSQGQLRLAIRATRLAVIVKSAIEAIRPSAEARQIALDVQLSDAVGVVRVDPDRIQQVVWNLLSNAVKFTPAAGKISVHLSRHDNEVEIRVADTGSGIPEEFLPHVFERFRQAEVSTTRKHGGLGLGLSIAKQLVELHGGTIAAESPGEGRGATFTVRLPLGSTEDSPDVEGADESQIKQDLQDLNILLIEDNAATREATKQLLEMYGAKVESVPDAIAARDAYLTLQPAVILCDIGLPGEDGFSLIEQIRAIEHDRNLSRVPAIAVTAFVRAEDQAHALNAGFDGHLAKPVDIHALVTAVKSFKEFH